MTTTTATRLMFAIALLFALPSVWQAATAITESLGIINAALEAHR